MAETLLTIRRSAVSERRVVAHYYELIEGPDDETGDEVQLCKVRVVSSEGPIAANTAFHFLLQKAAEYLRGDEDEDDDTR